MFPLWRPAIIVVAVLMSIAMLWWAQEVFIPLVLAVLLTYALEPIHRRLVRVGMPPGLSAAIVLVFVLSIVSGGLFILRDQAAGFAQQLPVVTEKVRELVRNSAQSPSNTVGKVQQAASEIKKAADETAPPPPRGVTRVQVEEPPLRWIDLVWKGSLSIIGIAIQGIIILFLVFYLLASGDLYKRKLVKIAGPVLSLRRLTVEILDDITRQIERFIMARILISVMVGFGTGVAFWILGVGQPGMWGLAAGVLNTVPYLGPSAITIASGLVALLQFGTWRMALTVAGAATLVASIEGMFITPLLMGQAGRMSPLAIFIGLSFWGWLWGISGLLLAVPLLMIIKAVCDHIEGLGWISELLGR